MPLECAAEHADKVELEVRSAVRLARVPIAVAGLGLAVERVAHQVRIDTWEVNHLQETRSHGTRLVVAAVRGQGFVVAGAGSYEDVVHTEAVLDSQDEGHGGVIPQVLAHVAGLDDQLDTVLGQLVGRPNAAEHEQLGAFKDTLREDDLTGGVEAELGAGAGDDSHTGAGVRGLRLERTEETMVMLGLSLRKR